MCDGFCVPSAFHELLLCARLDNESSCALALRRPRHLHKFPAQAAVSLARLQPGVSRLAASLDFEVAFLGRGVALHRRGRLNGPALHPGFGLGLPQRGFASSHAIGQLSAVFCAARGVAATGMSSQWRESGLLSWKPCLSTFQSEIPYL